MKAFPKKGEMIRHPQTGEPLLVVRKFKTADGTTLAFKTTSGHEYPPIAVPDPFPLEYYPCKGDRVVVADAPYQEWIREKIAQAKKALAESTLTPSDKGYWKLYHEPQKLWDDRHSFPIHEVFTLAATSGGVAVVVANGNRYTLPIKCLKVLEKAQAQQQAIAS